MPPLPRDDVEAALKRKGFVEEERDHRYYRLMVGDQYTGIYTKTSRGTGYKTLGDELIALMARQLKLTKKQFLELVSCTLGLEEYLELLRDRNEL